ncbi:hypothetical protein GC163_02625 [bacterium]|nr:hypothetical protein [bacterium]
MPTGLDQLLSAAVAELSSLHARIDALQQQIDELRIDRDQIPESSGRESTQVLIGEKPAITVKTATDAARTSHSPAAITKIDRQTPAYAATRIAGGIPTTPPEPVTRRFEFQDDPDQDRSAGHSSGYDGDQDANGYQRRPFVKWLPTSDTELPMIEARCRLKAEASRWADQRRRLADYHIEVEPRDRELIAQAKQLPDCFLWMSHSSAPNPTDPHEWQVLGGCFDALGAAVSVINRILVEDDEAPEYFEKAVDLLAESQSALRMIVTRLDGPPTDHDQARIFGWLKNIALERQIFIRRFMRLDDPANPDRYEDLLSRISAFEEQWENGRKKSIQRKKAISRLRYKLSLIDGMNPKDAAAAWQSIADDVDQLVTDGLPPSNIELRDLLAGHVEQFPELASTPKGFQLTVREIDKFLASSPSRDDKADTSSDDDTSPIVAEAANLLAGKAVIIIGGDRRPFAAEALERSFLLSELIWIDTRAHESVSGFEPYVARPDVALVLLAIRWSSHSYGEVQDFCRVYNKPLVRLPGGYNPNQVAAQIHEQCSGRLVSE